MPTPVPGALAADTAAVSPASPDDVAVLRHPDDDPLRRHLARLGLPRLLLVPPTAPPPAGLDNVEDWVRVPADVDEVTARRRTVLERYQRSTRGVRIDADGLLRVDDRWVDLPARPRAVAFPLVNHLGRPVPHAVVLDQYLAAGGPSATALRTVVQRLRARLAGIGLVLHTLRQGGYLLERP
jgi:hypothetical protein